MADVLLTVGVNPNIDFSQFEKDLDAVFSKYEKSSKKRTIDVEFTLSSAAQSSLDSLDAKLKSIQDRAIATSTKLKGINTALEGSSPKDSQKISQNTKLYQDSVKAIKEYYDALRKLNTYKTDITEVNGIYQSEGKWNNLAKELNETSAAYQRISNVIKTLPESMGTRLADEMLAAQRKFNLWLEERKNTKTTDMTSEVEKQQELIDKAIMLQNRLRSNISGYSAAGNNQSTKGIFEGLKVRISDIDTLIESLKSGKISAEEFANAIDQCAKKTAQDVAALKADGVARKSWADSFKGALNKFSAWLTASQMIMLAVRSMKQMVNEAISVDSAMTQMQIVTKASSSEMKAFGETAAAVAKQTASSMTDIIDSATTYARLGYNSETSTMLAKYTSMISKVGDIDVSEVQSAVTAIVKAFKVDANDAAAVEAVFDKLITTGNNLPISVKELAEGLNNASSALAAAGNSYEESLAMLAASNATVQDVSKSSTGLRTIVARIRNTKTELDDLGESMTNVEYDNIVKALTQYNVSLTDSQGNLRSSYEIFKDIAKVANELKATSPNDYAALAETLAGTRMQNVFFSLVENFDEAEKAMNLMDKSAGSLDEAFSTYSDSIAAHVQQFKTQFQELSVAIVDSGLAKGIVDIGTGILNLATAITKAGMALPTLLAGIAAFKSLQRISSIASLGDGGIKSFADLTKYALDEKSGSNIIKTLVAIKTGFTNAGNAASANSGKVGKFFSSIGGGLKSGWQSISLLGKLSIGIAAVSAAYAYLAKREQEARAAMQESFDSNYSAASEGSEVYDLYKSYEEARAAYDGSADSKATLEAATISLAEALGYEKDKIDEVKDSLKGMTEAELQQAITSAENSIIDAQKKLSASGRGGSVSWEIANNKGYIRAFAEMLAEDNPEEAGLYNLDAATAKERADNLLRIYDAMLERREELKDANMTDTRAYDSLNKAINYLRPDVEDLRNAQDLLTESTERYNSVVEGTVNNMSGDTGGKARDLKQTSKDVVNAVNAITNAQKILNSQETGKSISMGDFTAEGMEAYASALEYVNGVYQLNAERVNEIIQAKTEEQVAINDTNKAYAQQEYLKNAKQIEKYREELKKATEANDGSAKSIQDNIDILLKENAALRDECNQYDLMSAVLIEATSAYQNWLNAKSAAQSGDMFDGALSAIKQIDDVLNNTDSDLFGRVGRTDYKAAVDFIVPDSVDTEDAAAVNAYMNSIKDMFTYDKDGNRTGLNIENFIKKSLDAGLLAINDAGTAYEIAGGKTMEDFANGLGLSLPLVRAMFGELEEFGAKFDWSDEAAKTIGDLGVAAYEAAEGLRSIDKYKDLKIVMDVSEFEDADKACETLESTIKQMQEIKVGLSTDDAAFQQANDVIQYCIAQKQLLSAPAVMSVDVSKVTSDIAPALDLLQQFQNAQNTLEMKAAVGADTSPAEAEIDGLVSQIQGLDPEILAKLGLDPTSAESIQTYINGLDAEAIIAFGVDSSLVDAFEKASHSARGVVNWYDNTANLSKSFSRVGYVYWQDANSPGSSSGGSGSSGNTGNHSSRSGNFVNGSANAYGSAKLSGDWRVRGGRSLVGELGREIVVDPNTGRWYTVGDNGAEFVNLPDGAIVFNHVQSNALLENGRVAGRGKSYVNGSAFVTGSIPIGIGGNRPNPGYTNPSNGAGSSIENNYSKELETFDWIEIAINRIQRVIERLGKTADSVFKSLRTRLSATDDEITAVTQEIGIQQQAYEKYMSAAEAVNLSSDLKQLVRSGAIDISQYDQDTQKLINDYKDLYEKALDCADAVDDLHENLAELYKSRFDNIQKDFENKIALMEKSSDAYNRKIDMLEEQGYLQNADYYKKLQDNERTNITTLNKELASLQAAMAQAMASGEIEEGSEAWYEMKLSIEDVKASIEDAELAIIKYDNTMRQISWDYFDYAQERVGQITSEADFLLNLLDGKDMYDENGNLSDNGIATAGLRAEKYGVYMAQADKYAEEIKRINKELADDPNNTKLIKRRDELLASQRDAILAAKSEKEAMVSLVAEGINVELDAIKRLIDAYTESLDSAKDLYEYQKKIADKTENITELEKQLAAYQNDMSEETRAKIQKIEVELKNAREDLKDTEYDRFVSDTKKTLDSLYSEYEEILNSRFDDAIGTFERLIDLVNDNYIDINEYISKEAAAVGYAITEATNSIWANGGGVNGLVSEYGTDVTTKLTAVGLTVENIFGVLEEIARANGVAFTGKSYSSGGLVDYTGIANVHGSSDKPELVLDAEDTKNFLLLRDALRNMSDDSLRGYGSIIMGDAISQGVSKSTRLVSGGNIGDCSVGSINVTIPIEHVEEYNDFVNQLKNDRQFEQMIQSMTIGRIAGKSSLEKNKYKW